MTSGCSTPASTANYNWLARAAEFRGPQGTQIAIVWTGINDVRRQGKPVSFVQEMRRKITANLRARGIEVVNLRRDAGTGLRNNPKFTTGDGDMHFKPPVTRGSLH